MEKSAVSNRGFALILVLGLLTSLTILFAIVNARSHTQALAFAGQRTIIAAAEERSMLVRLDAEHFGRGTGEMVLTLRGRDVPLTVEEDAAQRSYVVHVAGQAVAAYWVAPNGSIIFASQ